MPTTGRDSATPAIDPYDTASPKAKTSPSDAASQYPALSGVVAMPTTGAVTDTPPMDPQ